MKVVYKFQLWPPGCEFVEPGMVPLHVASIDGQMFMWAEVDDSKPKTKIKVEIIPTGYSQVQADYVYLGTILEDEGALVLHVYYQKEEQ